MKSVKIIVVNGHWFARTVIKSGNKTYGTTLALHRLTDDEWAMAGVCRI